MKIGTVHLVAWSALAAAQVTFNNNTGEYTCDRPNANFCGGSSLQTDLIVRCDNASQGQLVRCTENLAGQEGQNQGAAAAVCYQSSPEEGDAACARNCVVYPEGREPFTLPPDECTPQDGGGAGNQTTTTVTTPAPAPTVTDVVATAGAAHDGVGALAIAGFAAVFFL